VITTGGETVVKNSIIKVVREIISDDTWTSVSDEELVVEVLNGGLTNILYTVENTVTGLKVIVRLFGSGTSVFIDREDENIVFAQLSRIGLGPTFYGLFLNGRVEGYINARVCTGDEMYSSIYSSKIATALGQLHNQEIPDLRLNPHWLWDKLELYFKLGEGIDV
jgi:thiamine kinase-like enzyme